MAYRYTLAAAIRDGWLSDYRLVVIGVNETEARRLLTDLSADDDHQYRPPDHHRREERAT